MHFESDGVTLLPSKQYDINVLFLEMFVCQKGVISIKNTKKHI